MFLKKIFGRKKELELVDADLGLFRSSLSKGSDVIWSGKAQFFGNTIDLIIAGNLQNLFISQKKNIISALSNEELIRAESTNAISKEYENADMKFDSLDQQMEVSSITVNEDGFELSFEQKESPHYYFNVIFENNKQQGVSIDS